MSTKAQVTQLDSTWYLHTATLRNHSPWIHIYVRTLEGSGVTRVERLVGQMKKAACRSCR